MKDVAKSQIIAGTKAIPALPRAATKLFEMLQNPDADMAEIEGILRFEPGLTANILKLTNSAYFGLPNKVGSIRQALVLLGRERLVELTMVTCAGALMWKSVPGYNLSPGELWRHSIAVSLAAEGLVKVLNLPEDKRVFTAALLHDIGKLVMGDWIKGDIEKIDELTAQGTSFEVAERLVLGTDHAEIGAEILKSWAFPQELVMAVRWHHQPERADEPSTMVDIVHVANVLCLMIGIGIGIEGLRYELSSSATEKLGLKPADIEQVASSTLQWVDELGNIFV
ncbi:MAG: HDOD domain-containing protein [Deltaproteobacteria bacterium]|nr:HDOD domain-containing protein [Deltaproteobacteria bacterium]